MKILTICYILILAVIVFIAGKKSTRYLLEFVAPIPHGDKIGHFLLMGFLSFLLNLTLGARSLRFGPVRYLTGSLVVAAVVTLEEISQLFIRGRTFDLLDLIADYAGILVFGELARALCSYWSNNDRGVQKS